MILIDSDVFSALMAEEPVDVVVQWLERHDRTIIGTTSISIFEVRFGIQRRPPGRRRFKLERGFERVMREIVQDRIVGLDAAAAVRAAELAATRELDGINVGTGDTLIAGIVIAHGATLATRNVRHFADLAIDVVNPWGPDDPGPDA